jgi:hypothetical protein
MTITTNDERRVRQRLQRDATSDGGGSKRWSKYRDGF